MSDIKIFKSACRMCHGGCGVLVHVKDGKVIKIEGDPDSPLNKGSLCPKGKASIEHLYNKNRLKYPLKRVGERGDGKWKRIKWHEALDIIAEKLNYIKENFGPQSVVFGQGTGRHHYAFVIEFAHEFGSPNWTEPGLAQCFVPRSLSSSLTYGSLAVCDYYGKVNPKCILVWGHNPINSGPDGEIAYRFLQAVKKGSKVIAVDPRKSETVEKSDLWLQIRPGTDDALALAMINVIIEEKLYDRDFVERWTIGFDKLKEHIKEYSPEWAEKITWIKEEDIKKAARMYATEKPSCIEWGVAIEHTPNSLQTCRAISILRALTGNLDVPGGEIFNYDVLYGFPNFWDSRKNMRTHPIGNFRFLSAAHFPSLLKTINTEIPYPIKAFLIFGNNTLTTYANSKEVYESLMKVDFLVVSDIYMTPTAEIADIVLPAATWLELDQILGVPFGSNKVILSQRKIVESFESKQDEWIILELCKRLDLPLGRVNLETLLDYQLSSLGINFRQLKKRGHIFLETTYFKYKKSGFNTQSGKVELYSTLLYRKGLDPLPTYMEPPESPYSNPELAKKYPFILTTGSRVKEFFHSEGRQIKSLREKHLYPLVEINEDTAKKLNIKNGDWVFIETLRGRIKQKAKLTKTINPNVINVEHGWWFPERNDKNHGVWISNANVLTNNKPPFDPGIGTYQLRGLLCKIYPVKNQDN